MFAMLGSRAALLKESCLYVSQRKPSPQTVVFPGICAAGGLLVPGVFWYLCMVVPMYTPPEDDLIQTTITIPRSTWVRLRSLAESDAHKVGAGRANGSAVVERLIDAEHKRYMAEAMGEAR